MGGCPKQKPPPSAVFFMPDHLRSSKLGSGSRGIKKPGYCRVFAWGRRERIFYFCFIDIDNQLVEVCKSFPQTQMN